LRQRQEVEALLRSSLNARPITAALCCYRLRGDRAQRPTWSRRLDYQVETVLKVLRTFRGRALLADEVGLGKTIEAGMLISEFHLRGLARRTLVIAPAALVGQWQAELLEKFSITTRSTEDPSFRSDPVAAWNETAGVVVASLQLVRTARHAELVRAQKWDLVVVDEAHHIKNRDTASYHLVETATQSIPVAHVRLDNDQPLRPNQVARAAQAWTLRNGLVDVGDVRLGPQARLWLDALAILHGDEKREQLVSTLTSAHSATPVEGFSELAGSYHHRPACAPSEATWSVVERALATCSERAERAAESFRAAMTRRFERDRASIEGYFDDLARELDKRAARGRLDHTTVADKRAAMHADHEAKLGALRARFVLRIEVAPIALRTITIDGAYVNVKLRRRKATRPRARIRCGHAQARGTHVRSLFRRGPTAGGLRRRLASVVRALCAASGGTHRLCGMCGQSPRRRRGGLALRTDLRTLPARARDHARRRDHTRLHLSRARGRRLASRNRG